METFEERALNTATNWRGDWGMSMTLLWSGPTEPKLYKHSTLTWMHSTQPSNSPGKKNLKERLPSWTHWWEGNTRHQRHQSTESHQHQPIYTLQLTPPQENTGWGNELPERESTQHLHGKQDRKKSHTWREYLRQTDTQDHWWGGHWRNAITKPHAQMSPRRTNRRKKLPGMNEKIERVDVTKWES